MGTLDRLAEVERYLARKHKAEIARKNKNLTPLRVAFFDRDGTLNEPLGLITSPTQLILKPGAAENVSRLTAAGFSCYVLTNQPVIARGLCNEEDLAVIHGKLIEEIARHGGRIDGIYYCPHHPETHYGEGISSLRIACGCRKPAPGMIFQAVEEHNFDLAECVMIGDTWRDMGAAHAAGIRSVLVGNDDSTTADFTASSLTTAVDWVLARAEIKS